MREFNIDGITRALEPYNVFFVASRPVDGSMVGYYSMQSQRPAISILVEITIREGVDGAKLCVKSTQPVASKFTLQAVELILSGSVKTL